MLNTSSHVTPTTRKTNTLSEQQDAWIKSRIESGDFTNDSKYIRDRIHRDQEQTAKYPALKSAIHDGIDSGIDDRTLGEIWEEAEQRHRQLNG